MSEVASASDHASNLSRVSARIADLILAFCRERLATNQPEFHMVHLLTYVSAGQCVAPDSAGRILRDLKAKGRLSYELVSRHGSLYCVKAVAS